MKAIILNYNVGCVEVANLPNTLIDNEGYDTTEKIESYLSDVLDFKLSEIAYMISDDDEVPVYQAGEVIPMVTI